MLLCSMKRHIIKIIIATLTFIFGVFIVALWFYKSSQKAQPDLTVYSVNFCDLCKNSAVYDGKIVRTQAVYSLYAESSHLYDYTCNVSMQPDCAASDNQCNEIYNRRNEAMRGRLPKVKIDVIGRYTIREDKTPLFEMLELKSVEPTEEPDRGEIVCCCNKESQ